MDDIEMDDAKESNNSKAQSSASKKNISDISNSLSSDNSAGEIAKNFGTGDNAKINLILYIISTTLIIFSSIAAAIMVINIFGFDTEKIIQHIKDLWAVFTPIITLGLGYLFGANKGDEVKDNEKNESKN